MQKDLEYCPRPFYFASFLCPASLGFPGGHTEITNGQYGLSRDCVKPANSLRIGNFAPIAAFYNNGSSRYGFSFGIQYTDRAILNRVNSIPGLRQSRTRPQTQQCKTQNGREENQFPRGNEESFVFHNGWF